MSKLFRKKTSVVRAVQFLDKESVERIAEINTDFECGLLHVETFDLLRIFCRSGIKTALKGDWVVRGEEDELYVVGADVFNKTYEPVEGKND